MPCKSQSVIICLKRDEYAVVELIGSGCAAAAAAAASSSSSSSLKFSEFCQ